MFERSNRCQKSNLFVRPLHGCAWGRCAAASLLGLMVFLLTTTGRAATIGADGGITLYISYDNPDIAGGASWNDPVTQVDSVVGGVACDITNDARADHGFPNSPGSCVGGNTCSGQEKLQGDIERLAEYIYQATHGAHYLRRVYVSDEGRAWTTADIRWSVGSGGSSAWVGGWALPDKALKLRSGARRCIHDVVHHELGHYFYALPDRYAKDASDGYYWGRIDGGTSFPVSVDVGDPNTVMSSNFPHWFVDTTNAELTLTYTPPSEPTVNGEVLTPDLLVDGDPSNDGPDRAHHGFTMPFAQDEWSVIPSIHADLTGVHTEGDFEMPDMTEMPDVEIRWLGEDEPHPGTILLLDRSGSMGVLTDGVPASQFVQEAGMYLYHSSLPGDLVGTQLYNDAVEILFDYEEYDETNQLPFAVFRTPTGLTNIAAALKSAIDELIAAHGEEGVNGAQIVLMSDGKQTTGPDLWDEVTRANDHGILIHTLSFGNADIPTMTAIAGAADGEIIEMSENTDGPELKHVMSRELSTLRGMTPLHLITEDIYEDRKDEYQGTFEVPPSSRNVQFYLFLRKHNAADLHLELEDPHGNVFKATPKNVADMGRLNGVTAKAPEPGTWYYRIMGSKETKYMLPEDVYEMTAYVENRDLSTDVRVEPIPGTEYRRWRIIADLSHRYPLMSAKAEATIRFGGRVIDVLPLYDDGKKNIDDVADDGVYSALFIPEEYDMGKNRSKARIDVEFVIDDTTRPAPNAHYEVEADIKGLSENYFKFVKHNMSVFVSKVVSFEDKSAYRPAIVSVSPYKQIFLPKKSIRTFPWTNSQTLLPKGAIEISPGDKGTLKVGVKNTILTEKSLRVALGNDVAVSVAKIVPDFSNMTATVLLDYTVDKKASPGRRTLVLQSNHTRLERESTLIVTK